MRGKLGIDPCGRQGTLSLSCIRTSRINERTVLKLQPFTARKGSARYKFGLHDEISDKVCSFLSLLRRLRPLKMRTNLKKTPQDTGLEIND